MRVLVCVKRVPAPGAKINITPDALAVDTAFLGFTTSPHEECAVEAALQLVEAHGGEATVLTLGPAEAAEQLRYALSLGIDRAVLVSIDGNDWDSQSTAAALTTAIAELEAADGPFDLVLFGNESADACGFQTGIRVAVALDRPMVNGAKQLTLDRDAHRVIVEREADAGREVYELEFPAVVGVKEGINLPRYPTMKGRLASKKREIATHVPVGGAIAALRTTSLATPPADDRTTVMLGSGPGAAAAVVDLLEELGLA